MCYEFHLKPKIEAYVIQYKHATSTTFQPSLSFYYTLFKELCENTAQIQHLQVHFKRKRKKKSIC